MTLQEQVCTLEQAKRLKELGCEQNTSIFYWYKNKLYLYGKPTQFTPVVNSECTDAYTVAELGEMLMKLDEDIRMPAVIHGAWRHYSFWHGRQPFPTEAQARAALLIHILEQEKENSYTDEELFAAMPLDYEVNIPPKSSRTVKAITTKIGEKT